MNDSLYLLRFSQHGREHQSMGLASYFYAKWWPDHQPYLASACEKKQRETILNRSQWIPKPPKTIYSEYFRQWTDGCTQCMKMHLNTVYSIFPPGILIILKSIANCIIETKPDVMPMPQVSRVRENCCSSHFRGVIQYSTPLPVKNNLRSYLKLSTTST